MRSYLLRIFAARLQEKNLLEKSPKREENFDEIYQK